ncbi:MAG TPA: alpha/beta hydrolase [Candidatus Nanopelagicaceae bacterium]|nr:alpha/beta hydrolase [Candidatus Nanopelagicaceae bacterium]
MDWPAGRKIWRVEVEPGVRIAVHGLGSGRPLLLIPGLGTDHHAFGWNIAELAEHWRCLALDQRGIGGSDATPGPYTMDQLADDAARVIAEMEPQGVAVFGVSMGGMVAQHLAIRHPRLVTSLVLGCTGPGGPLAVRADPNDTRLLLGGEAKDPGLAYRVACQVLYERGWREAHPEVIEDAVSWRATHPVRAGVFGAQWAAIRGHDTGAHLDRIEAPTMVLHGTADVVMPPGNGALLAERIPGARLEWLPGRGHMFFQEDPAQTVSLLEGHLEPAMASRPS